MINKLKTSPKITEFKQQHPNANAVVIVLGIIMLWRGAWGLMDTYLFPGSPTFSYLLSIALGALVLYLDDFSINNLKR